ncbi:MAG TPA: hypothetical protein VF773_15210 [Verrucomicrobiae bacterium]
MNNIVFIALAAAPLLFAGCSSNTASQAGARPAKDSRPTPAPTENTTLLAMEVPKSVFSVDGKARDPFFPNARKTTIEVNTDGELALDIPAMLQANLHGIISSGGKSIAYVSNVMLEPGRNALIPIRAGGQERLVSVRCREVTKEAVVLEVQGYPEPVTLTRVAR